MILINDFNVYKNKKENTKQNKLYVYIKNVYLVIFRITRDFNLVLIIGYVISECNLFPSFGNSKSSYARSNYKCKILVSITWFRVSKTWKQVTLANYASQLFEPNWNPW